MTKKASSYEKILGALPDAQESVRKEIQARIDAGEKIATMDSAEMQERSRALLESLRPKQLSKKSAA